MMRKSTKTAILFFGFVLVVLLGCRAFYSGPEIRNSKPTGADIICFGDSLTSGFGASPGMDYPSQLARIIGRPVINAGVEGDTTAGALTRLNKDVLTKSPRIVLITLGGNDLWTAVEAEVFSKNLKTIIELIQGQGSLVIVGGIEIPFWGEEFWKVYKQVGQETGAVLINNIFQGIIDKPELMADLIHPNSAGYTIIAQRFYKALKPYL
jgi:lysophospholipase L1-like esterase